MQPATHLLMSWSVAEAILPQRRDRLLAAWGGILPDLDGFGYPVQLWTADWDQPLRWYSDYHHVLGHGLAFALLWTGITLACARQRLRAAVVAFGVIHLHLLADLVGSGGPDGSSWPIAYLWPLSSAKQHAPFQWALDAWPNYLIGIVLLAWVAWRSWRVARSPLDLFSRRADAAVVATLRRRFGEPSGSGGA